MIFGKRFRSFSFFRKGSFFHFSKKKLTFLFLGFLALLFIFFSVGPEVPPETIIAVHQGETLADVSKSLAEAKIIRSSFMLRVLSRALSHKAVAGSYKFEGRTSLFAVSNRLNRGEFGILAVRILIPEGSTRRQIAAILDRELSLFDTKKFLEITKNEEGFLFPDTYLLPLTTTTEEAADALRKNFDEKIRPFEGEIQKRGITTNELITMASIVEREVRTTEDRKKVAGILWKRIQLKIPLQVDAVFVYSIGKGSYDLTQADLQKKSDYNTYTNLGLPPGPIASPGLDSIRATLYYEDSPYLFYLSDRKGITHYSVTYEEHVQNKKKYIY